MSDTNGLGRSLLPMRRGQSARLDGLIKVSFQKQLGDSVGEPFGSLDVDGMTSAVCHYHRDICSRGAGEYYLAVSYNFMLWVDERDIIFRQSRKVSVRKLIVHLEKVLHRHEECGFVNGDTGFCTVSVYIIVR